MEQVICAGALVSSLHVLTSLACALTLRGHADETTSPATDPHTPSDDEEPFDQQWSKAVVKIGNETFFAAESLLNPNPQTLHPKPHTPNPKL